MYKYVNTSHPQQDIQTTRPARPDLFRFKLAASLLALPADDQARCLELGGGAAEFSLRLRDLGYNVTFTDLNPTSVEHARALGFESLQLDFNEGLPGLPDAGFDLAVMLDVIEHIVSAERLLAEVHRVLKPDGSLILSTPNFGWWYNRLRILFGGLDVAEGYHYRFFTIKSLGGKLNEAGFGIQDWRFSSPAYGINHFNRLFRKGERVHFKVPKWIAPVLAQTILVRAKKIHE